MRHLFIAMIFLLAFGQSFACENPTSLSVSDKTKWTKLACESFERIYGPWMSVDKSLCLKETKLKLCQNDPAYGTFLFGKLVYDDFRSKDCNFLIVKGKITGADCGDE